MEVPSIPFDIVFIAFAVSSRLATPSSQSQEKPWSKNHGQLHVPYSSSLAAPTLAIAAPWTVRVIEESVSMLNGEGTISDSVQVATMEADDANSKLDESTWRWSATEN